MPQHSRKVQITEQTSGRRADAWLSQRFGSWSRSQMAREILAGRVQSDRRELKPSSLVQNGEILEITIPGLAPTSPPPSPPPVIYEDERLLVVNKPPGLLCHPAGDRWEWGIIGLVRESRPGPRLELAHRLDRDTSGVLVLTKDMAANIWLKDQLRHRGEGLRKEYLALVHDHPEWKEKSVNLPLGEHPNSAVRLKRGVVPNGLPSLTHFTLKETLDSLALVHCLLHTGRTHQIRIHLDHIGHPILGDRLYGQPESTFLEWLAHREFSDVHPGQDNPHFQAVRKAVGFPRQALHAWRMQIPHPDGHRVQVEAPLPRDMQEILEGTLPTWPDPSTCSPAPNGQS